MSDLHGGVVDEAKAETQRSDPDISPLSAFVLGTDPAHGIKILLVAPAVQGLIDLGRPHVIRVH